MAGRTRLILAALCLALSAPATASASSTMKVGVADDGLMQGPSAEANLAASQWRANGVDQSRLMLVWAAIAPNPEKTRPPTGFDPQDPQSSGYDWTKIDRAVAALKANSIEPTFLLTTPAPIWGSAVPSRREPTYKPSPSQFADFVHAVIVRYGEVVKRYSLINEPNLWHWLTPQWSCTTADDSSCKAASPAIYRELFRAGYDEIKLLQPSASVWGGSLAPVGTSSRADPHSSLAPLNFLRRLGCVKENFTRDRTSSGCRDFTPLTVDAIAHHPHTAWMAPRQRPSDADSVTVGTLSRLTKTLDRIQARGGIRNGSQAGAAARTRPLEVEIDEFGIQTDPPDQWSGVSLRLQSDYLQEIAFLLWKNPRVKLFTQYLWRDEPLDKVSITTGSWQSGLYFADGEPKPSAGTFSSPFWVELAKHSGRATVWGQVRPGGATEVTVQSRSAGSARFSAFRTETTNNAGYFHFTTTVRKRTSFRFFYGPGNVNASSVRTVTPH